MFKKILNKMFFLFVKELQIGINCQNLYFSSNKLLVIIQHILEKPCYHYKKLLFAFMTWWVTSSLMYEKGVNFFPYAWPILIDTLNNIRPYEMTWHFSPSIESVSIYWIEFNLYRKNGGFGTSIDWCWALTNMSE